MERKIIPIWREIEDILLKSGDSLVSTMMAYVFCGLGLPISLCFFTLGDIFRKPTGTVHLHVHYASLIRVICLESVLPLQLLLKGPFLMEPSKHSIPVWAVDLAQSWRHKISVMTATAKLWSKSAKIASKKTFHLCCSKARLFRFWIPRSWTAYVKWYLWNKESVKYCIC